MCIECWRARGCPAIINEQTLACLEAVRSLYEHNAAGGNAHIVTDDNNIEEDHINWCLNEAVKHNRVGSTLECLDAERKVLELMLALSEAERASVLAMHQGLLATPRLEQQEVQL